MIDNIKEYNGTGDNVEGNTLGGVPEPLPDDKCQCRLCKAIFEKEDMYEVEGDILCRSCFEEECRVCAECSESFYVENMTEIDGEYYCESCRDENFCMCADCEDWFPMGNMTEINEGDYVCSHCRDENYGYCDDCERWYSLDNIREVEDGDRSVCDDCFGENYRECECGYIGHTDDMAYCDNCDSYFCSQCGCDCEDGVRPVLRPAGGTDSRSRRRPRANFSEQKPSLEPLVGLIPNKVDFGRLVGVELEVEGGNGKYVNAIIDGRVGISHDGSLSNGCELQTPPASFEKLSKLLVDTTKALKENEFYVNKRCGLHIHLDASDFKFKYSKIAKIVKTYYSIEDVFYKMLPQSRRDSHYCQPLRNYFSIDDFNPKSLGLLEKVWYGKGNQRLAKVPDAYQIDRWKKDWRNTVRSWKKDKYNDSRYLGINMHSIFYRGTLEIRHHSGTLNAKKILHWINFNSAVVEYALKRYKEEEVLELLKKKPTKKKLTEVARMLRLSRTLKNYLENRFNKFSRANNEEEPDLSEMPF